QEAVVHLLDDHRSARLRRRLRRRGRLLGRLRRRLFVGRLRGGRDWPQHRERACGERRAHYCSPRRLTLSGVVSPRRLSTCVTYVRKPCLRISIVCDPSATSTTRRSCPAGPRHGSPSMEISASIGCTRTESVP